MVIPYALSDQRAVVIAIAMQPAATLSRASSRWRPRSRFTVLQLGSIWTTKHDSPVPFFHPMIRVPGSSWLRTVRHRASDDAGRDADSRRVRWNVGDHYGVGANHAVVSDDHISPHTY